MPTPGTSLSRIIQVKRPWRKLLGHVFHTFGGKSLASITGMFAWSPPAGRTQLSKGMQRASHLQGKSPVQGKEQKDCYWSAGNSVQNQSVRSFVWATF